jgi:hypothetical protein
MEPDEPAGRPAPSDPHTAARAYAALGWRVVPIAPGQKRPTLPRWSQAATDDLTIIDSWWTGLYRGHGVGIATGTGTGLWVLDVDVADEKAGADSLADLQQTHGHGRLPRTVTAVTGSGGLHFLFTWDPAHPVTNGDAVHLGPGLDIRGEGGQIVVAPTVHPNGIGYVWSPGRDPWTIDPSPAPGWLYEILHPPTPPSPAGGIPVTALNPTTGAAEGSIADWVRQTYRWRDALEADGWTLHSTRHDQTWWTRPGKATRDGHSAVLHGDGGPLVIFTTEIPPTLTTVATRTADGAGWTVSLFDYLAGTRHGGDRSALARAAVADRARLEPPPTVAAAGLLTAVAAPEPVGFVDLDDWWDRSEPLRRADVLTRTDGAGLLYGGDLNWIYGDSGSGKTWVALTAAVQLLTAGQHVVWIHYEDPTPATIIGRLKDLGLPRDVAVARLHYFDPQGAPVPWADLIERCHDTGVTWMTLDSVGEALNAVGVNEDSDTEVGPWLNTGPRAVVNAGIGFAGVDHGTKARNNKLHPSGSKRKRAAVTGAALLIETIISPTIDRDGMLRITCAKDRHGNHQQGSTVGIAHLRHDITTGRLIVTINENETTETRAAQHDTLTRAVLRAVADDPGLTKNQLERCMPTAGKDRRHAAIDEAVEAGLIRFEFGPRRAQLYFLVESDHSDDP